MQDFFGARGNNLFPQWLMVKMLLTKKRGQSRARMFVDSAARSWYPQLGKKCLCFDSLNEGFPAISVDNTYAADEIHLIGGSKSPIFFVISICCFLTRFFWGKSMEEQTVT